MSDETTRLRALLERATQTPWEVTEIRDGRQPEGVEELGVFAPCDVRSYQKPDETWHSALICRGMDGPTRAANAALIVGAVNALPGLLDAAERAERAERELAVTRAQQAPLVACVDALRAAATTAGWRDADATGEHLVAWVRRGAMLDAARIAMGRGGEWVAKAIVARINEEGGAAGCGAAGDPVG